MFSNGISGCWLVEAAAAGPFRPGASPGKMAAAARLGPAGEELALLEKALGLPSGNKYGAQGERQVKGARRGRGWERAAARGCPFPQLSPSQRLFTRPAPFPPRFHLLSPTFLQCPPLAVASLSPSRPGSFSLCVKGLSCLIGQMSA